ncbi:MAG TPA: protein kinase [Haliangium sp.]|nr:protein kinase [Haliangium sp.]
MTEVAPAGDREDAGSIGEVESNQRWGGPAVDGFAVQQLLGRGGFARVYLARRLDDGTMTAIKLAHARGDERLGREALWLARLGPPAAPRLWSHGALPDGRPFLVMEYLGTDSLARRLAARERAHAPAAEVAPVFAALCHAVGALHRAGVLHRDLKPENLLFRPGGEVAVIDYGIATAAAGPEPALAPGLEAAPGRLAAPRHTAEPTMATLTRPDETLGTPAYMAPEQWTGAAVDARTDVYALGVILFELLTGRPPFVGTPAAVRHGHVLGRCPAPSRLAEVDAAVDEVVLRCLAKEPAGRFGSADELGAALAQAVDARPAAARPVRAPGVPASPAAPEARPTVLLALDVAGDTPRVMELARLHDAVLAVREGTTHILVWPWASSLVRAMQSAARLVTAATEGLEVMAPAVVHVDELATRQRGARVRVLGPALTDLGWRRAPAGSTGLVLSPAAAAHAGEGMTVPLAQGFARLAPGAAPVLLHIDPEALPLRGRDALLDELLGLVRTCVRERRPLLATLLGDVGMGKTRALDALARALRPLDQPRVLYLRARQEAPGALVAALVRLALGLAPGTPGAGAPGADAPGAGETLAQALALAWSDAGGAPDGAGLWALAYHLGAAETGAPGVARVLAAPGALRQATASGLARLLVHAASAHGLVLLVDDAHWADHAALDALELGTMAEAGGGLVVISAARPAFGSLRPRWGDRAATPWSHTLAPLDEASARALVGDLLRPVEFVPRPVADRLHALTCGVPLYLVELGQALRESGAVRQQPGTHGYYLAADELLRAADTPVFARLAERLVASVPVPLLPVLELCALLDEGFTAAEVHGIQRALEADAGGAAGGADAAVALGRLEEMGVLAPAAQGYRFRHPLLAHAVASLIPGARKRAWHVAALRHYEQHAEHGTARARARHAAAAGATEIAVRIRLALAGEAHAQHRYVDAEACYSEALELMSPDHAARVQALAGRGSTRYRLQRFDDALADLRSARALAVAGTDEARALALLLEESTVLDWCQEWCASAALAELAGPLAERLAAAQPALAAAAELATGRALYRREQLDPAIAHLSAAVHEAVAAGAQEVHIMAALLLAPALVYAGRLDEAEATFADVIDLCSRAGDDFHRAAAHINRLVLWMKREEVDRAVADLEICMHLGRALGNAQIERGATFNLAELLHWCGQRERALALALRARALQMRFFHEHRFHDDALLLARILCPSGDAAAHEHLAWIEERCELSQMVPSAQVLLDMVRLAMADHTSGCFTPAAWSELAERAARHALLEERVEVLVCAADVALGLDAQDHAVGWLEAARCVAGDSRLWAPTLARLGMRCALPEVQHRDAG